MTTEVNLSNTRRKIRSLLAKTSATSGCTAAEKTSAMKMAKDLADQHILNKSDVIYDEITDAMTSSVADDIVSRAKVKEPTTARDDLKPKAEGVTRRTAKVPSPGTEKPSKPKRGDRIIELMAREGGVSIAELQKEFGSQPHTCRAQISVSARSAGFKPILVGGRYYRTAPKTK